MGTSKTLLQYCWLCVLQALPNNGFTCHNIMKFTQYSSKYVQYPWLLKQCASMVYISDVTQFLIPDVFFFFFFFIYINKLLNFIKGVFLIPKMATFSLQEHRVIICFLHLRGATPIEIHRQLNETW
jgi:hypothetical protein